MISQSEAHVLASPRVAIQSGNEGQIHIGDKFPLVRLNGQNSEFETDYLNLGLSLKALCTQLPEHKIRWRLRGEWILLDDLLAGRYPVIQRVAFEREVVLEEGRTLVIAGLTSREALEAAARAQPLLGDLPIQGSLYRNHAPGRELYLMVKAVKY
jgi:type II secretory pathway component GspD/PulD (secretin)